MELKNYTKETLILVGDDDLFAKIQHACKMVATLDWKSLTAFRNYPDKKEAGFTVDLVDFKVQGDKPNLIIWCSAKYERWVGKHSYSSIGDLMNALYSEELLIRQMHIK